MGIRSIDHVRRLIPKLKMRKLNKTGAIMMRPCFCDGEGLAPAGFCQIHDFWPIIQRSNLPGEGLFPTLHPKNLNGILKAISGRLEIESATKYSTKAFRRGAAMDIMASGSTLAQIMRSAGWRSQAFRAYLIFQLEEERNAMAVFAPSGRPKPKRSANRADPTIPPEQTHSPIQVSSETDSVSSSSLLEGVRSMTTTNNFDYTVRSRN